MINREKIAILLSALFVSSAVSADTIYNCNGVFTNKSTGKSCTRMKLKDNLSVIGDNRKPTISYSNNAPAPAKAANANRTKPNTGGGVQNASRGNYPVETVAENTARSNGRLSILQDELTNEMSALNKAQAELLAGSRGPNKQNLQGRVIDHQKNVEAIQREISRTR